MSNANKIELKPRQKIMDIHRSYMRGDSFEAEGDIFNVVSVLGTVSRELNRAIVEAVM